MRKLPGVLRTRVGWQRRRCAQRHLPQPRHPRRGVGGGVRPHADELSRPAGVLLPDPRSEHPGRQGNDRGSSYRSAIFYTSDEQLANTAQQTIADVNASGLWPGKVVTERPTGRSGRPSPSIRTTWSSTPTATPATTPCGLEAAATRDRLTANAQERWGSARQWAGRPGVSVFFLRRW